MNIISGSLPSLPSYDDEDEDEDVREEYLEHAKPICPRPSSSESRRRLFVRSFVPIGGNAERTGGRTDGRLRRSALLSRNSGGGMNSRRSETAGGGAKTRHARGAEARCGAYHGRTPDPACSRERNERRPREVGELRLNRLPSQIMPGHFCG